MRLWLRLGWRNLGRNRRRTAFTVAAVALGYAAVNLLAGFMLYVFRGLEDSYVYAFEGGHLTVFREGFGEAGAADPPARYFSAEDLAGVLEVCASHPGVVLATPRVRLTGLLSNGEVSSIMMADGKDAEDARFIREQARGLIRRIRMFEGRDLAGAAADSMAVSKGLAARLGLAEGSAVILMANTLDGYMNALDAEVVQLQDAPLEVLDEMLVTLPLETARRLLDTGGADRVVVLLGSGDELEAVQAGLRERLAAAGHAVEVENWKDLRVSYHRIRGMFTVLFTFVFIVVLLIVALSVVNTISMAVMERTREVGTLRALGLKRRGVLALLGVESAFLALIGCGVGFLLYLAAWQAVRSFQPTWVPPNIPKRVPWEIAWAPGVLLAVLCSLLLLAVLAAVLPARRAARMEVGEALAHT
jgi:putative ABC transport system permease protein